MTIERETGVTGTPASTHKVAEPGASYAVPTPSLAQRAAGGWQAAVEDEASLGSRFAQVMTKATAVLGDASHALRWIAHPALALDGHTPLALLQNPAGFEQVEDCLTRMEYGVYQ